jgi:hypothetical protein
MNDRSGSCGMRNDRPAQKISANMSANNSADEGARMDRCGGARVDPGNGARGEQGKAATELARIPEGVRASVASKPGEYDARRLRSQREIIRDVMVSAADCETWLTLGELRALTRYGEASISAQLRHLRKSENGGYDVVKRHREGGRCGGRAGADGRGDCVWEYRLARGICVERETGVEQVAGVGA